MTLLGFFNQSINQELVRVRVMVKVRVNDRFRVQKYLGFDL